MPKEPIKINADKFIGPGRPPKVKEPEEIIERALEYFRECEENEERPTFLGVSLKLGYSSLQGMNHAAEARNGYLRDAIEQVRTVIGKWRESQLGNGSDNGNMFVLKNMLGWRDDRHVDSTVKAEISKMTPKQATEALIATLDDDDLDEDDDEGEDDNE